MTQDEQNPIEPLSDATWNRIESAVFQELDDHAQSGGSIRARRAPLPRWVVATLAAVVVLQAAAAALFFLGRGDSPKQLVSTRFVAEHEPTATMLGDVSIRLERATALLVVENAAHSSLCVLERGAARFAVPKRGERAAFVVQAGDVRVEVIGTQFRVERRGSSARVDAYEGTVRVTVEGRAQLLTRGQHWSPPDADSQATTTTTTPTKPANAQPAPAAQIPEAPAQPESDTPSGQLASSDRQRARFEQATAREASDPRAALRIYRSLAREGGPWAANALYAQARLELDLGHRADALRLLHSYLARHPAGANASDARSLLHRLTRETDKAEP